MVSIYEAKKWVETCLIRRSFNGLDPTDRATHGKQQVTESHKDSTIFFAVTGPYTLHSLV